MVGIKVKTLLFLSILLVFQTVIGQSKYLENRYDFGSTTQVGHSIVSFEDQIQISGQRKVVNNNSNNVWAAIAFKIGTEGIIENYEEFVYEAGPDFSYNWYVLDMESMASERSMICGQRESYVSQPNHNLHGYLLFLDENCDSTSLFTFGYEGNDSGAYGCTTTIDDMFLVVGQTRINNSSTPYLVKMNESGEIQWERIYDLETEGSDWFKRVIQVSSGEIYCAGISNLSYNTEEANIAVFHLDQDGNELNRSIIDFGLADDVGELINT